MILLYVDLSNKLYPSDTFSFRIVNVKFIIVGFSTSLVTDSHYFVVQFFYKTPLLFVGRIVRQPLSLIEIQKFPHHMWRGV